MEEKRVIFNYISKNSDYITTENLKEFYYKFEHITLTDAQAAKIIKEFDTEQDGKISFDEFDKKIDLKIDDDKLESFYNYMVNKDEDDFDYDKIKDLYKYVNVDELKVTIEKHIKILKDLFNDSDNDKVSMEDFIKNFNKYYENN